MRVFSLTQNTEEYFEDTTEYLSKDTKIYLGSYSETPIFPLYTFSTNGRYNYTSQNIVIEFITMLPIHKLLENYLIEIRYRLFLNIVERDSILTAINSFNKYCKNCKNTIDVKSLIKTTQQ